MKNLYIIAGCNGAGKTTASFTVLPEILDCHEFVNADEIARGLSPFQPEKAAFESGRIMLNRIKALLESNVDFAFETTLSTRSYVNFAKKAQKQGYSVTLLFFLLDSVELAIERVSTRVTEGGHNIPEDVIRRRYERGLSNFFTLYKPIADNWSLINNSGDSYEIIAEKSDKVEIIINNEVWTKLKSNYDE
ncbi:MAG: zeta toxin family protein [Spirosomaceae bacterium]|nr:zeta toxin family protein [Spirosomataceae bacterium]